MTVSHFSEGNPPEASSPARPQDDPIGESELIDYASRVIATLKRDLESHSIWLRRSSGVDLVIGGHLRRATMAVESTILLARSGSGYDAAAT